MNSLSIFAGKKPVSDVGTLHYSWGGGTGDDLFGTEEAVQETLGGANLAATAYIDAVKYKGLGPVSRRPAADHFWNVYQENDFSGDFEVLRPEGHIRYINYDLIQAIIRRVSG